MASDDERRRGERVPVNREFLGGADTFVSDLSEHGVFVHTEQDVPIGTKVQLRFTLLLDDPVTVEAAGTVVRHQADPPGLGVEFGPMSPVAVLRIQDAITRMRPRDLGPPVRAGSGPAAAAGSGPAVGEGGEVGDDTRTARYAAVPVGEDDKTLVRLKAVDVEIVEDDMDEAEWGGEEPGASG